MMVSENGDGPKLRLFLACADIEQWPEWLDTGLVTGATTSPQLLVVSYSEGYDDLLPKLASKAPESGAEAIHLHAWGRDAMALRARGRKIAKLGEGVVVKIPITRARIKAAMAPESP
jgi:transaldolase